jgi:transposase
VIALRPGLKVLVASRPIDFRKGVHGLVALVAEALRADPYCGDIFIFRAKRADRLRVITWDGSGMVMVSKWLEEGHFTWPAMRDGAVGLSATQFAMLIDGLDWTKGVPKPVKRPTRVG